MAEELVIADLSICQPRECLTRETQRPGTWMLYDYETEEGLCGTMVYGAGRMESPQLRLSLSDAEGWYKIYVATWHSIHMEGSHLRLKLEQDRYYRQCGPEIMGTKDRNQTGPELMLDRDGQPLNYDFGPADLTESFWRVAELQEEWLTIDRVRTWGEPTIVNKAADPGACLAYVRLVPASPEERDIYAGRGRTQKPKVQFAQYDNGNWWQIGCRTEEDIRASLDWFGGTDLVKVNWGCYSNEGCCYPTQVGVQMGREPEVTRCIAEFFERGIDPLQVASEYAREIGLELYPSFRIGGKRPAPTLPTTNEMPFFDSHQGCVAVAPDGTPTPHYSFAYDEVREFFVDVVCEAAESYDVPGVHFIFARSNPFVLYEEKTVEEFRQQHGLDPRDLAEEDERWLAHRASYLTEFVRQLRQGLDEVGKKRGTRVELAVTVPSEPRIVPYWGVDCHTWARERLVDYLILHAGGVVKVEDLKGHVEAIGDTGVPVIVDFYPRRMPARSRLLRGMEYYDAGADGFCFWDGQARVNRASEFAWSRFLGHDEDLADWAERLGTEFRIVPMRTLQGYSLDRRFWTLTSG